MYRTEIFSVFVKGAVVWETFQGVDAEGAGSTGTVSCKTRHGGGILTSCNPAKQLVRAVLEEFRSALSGMLVEYDAMRMKRMGQTIFLGDDARRTRTMSTRLVWDSQRDMLGRDVVWGRRGRYRYDCEGRVCRGLYGQGNSTK
jgi:hypothetical protein